MSLHNKSEFRALCGGISINYLDVYIRRKQVIPEKKNKKSKDLFFDDTKEINRAFIVKNQERQGGAVSLVRLAEMDEEYRQSIKLKSEAKKQEKLNPVVENKKSRKPPTPSIDISKEIAQGVPAYKQDQAISKVVTKEDLDDASIVELEKKAKILDILKKQESLEIDRVKLAKLRGESIPVDMVKGVISRLQKSFVTEFHVTAEKIIQDIILELSGSRELLAKSKGNLIETINKSIMKSHENAIKEINSIVTDYAIKKAQGERE